MIAPFLLCVLFLNEEMNERWMKIHIARIVILRIIRRPLLHLVYEKGTR